LSQSLPLPSSSSSDAGKKADGSEADGSTETVTPEVVVENPDKELIAKLTKETKDLKDQVLRAYAEGENGECLSITRSFIVRLGDCP